MQKNCHIAHRIQNKIPLGAYNHTDRRRIIWTIFQLRYEHRDMKITLVKPDTDKITRLESVSSYIENGLILFPSAAPNWWTDFANELFMFPNTTFKDQCDAFSQCLHIAAPIATKLAPHVVVL